MPVYRSRLLRRAASRILAMAAVAVLAAGCFAGSPAAQGPGERLRVGLPFPPVAAMSPFSDDAVIASRLGAVETLVTLDADGTPQPALATRWAVTDPLTWRFSVRPGVSFHDGSPMQATQVADSLSRAAAASPTPRSLSGVQLSVTAEGPDTVVVRTQVPDPVLVQRLSSPELMILAPSAYTDPTRPTPVRTGTGPFVLDALQGTSTAQLSRNDRYWGGPAAAAGIDVRFLSEGAARANALRAGELDIAQQIPVAQVGTITDQDVQQVPLPRTVSAYLNQRSAVFADPAARSAARTALQSVDAAATIYEGLADPAAGLFGPASPFAARRPAVAPARPGLGTGAPIRIATYSDRPELPELAGAAAAALRQAGFTAEVVVQEYSTIEPQLLSGAFDMVIATRSYQVDTGDPVSYLASDYSCQGSYNLAQLCAPAVDAALVRADAQVDTRTRQDAALAVEARLLSAGVVVPIVHERARIGVAPGITGVARDPFERQLVTAGTVRQ